MKKLILAVIFFLLLTFPSQAFAQYVTPAVNPCINQLVVNKKILNPQNNQFVDDLNFDQNTFLADQDVIFRNLLTNVSQSDLTNIMVTDRIPDALNFVSTTFGALDPSDQSQKTIKFQINSLKIGETKTIEIRTKVRSLAEFSFNTFCQANIVRASFNNLVCEDTSRACFTKQVMGVTTQIPKTGPSQTLPILLLSSLFLAIGLLIKRIIILERR